jgi:hypothetical protein
LLLAINFNPNKHSIKPLLKAGVRVGVRLILSRQVLQRIMKPDILSHFKRGGPLAAGIGEIKFTEDAVVELKEAGLFAASQN